MAVKNHKLDQAIIDAAKKEFLEKGFQKASLHKIAENAGITTGALYTRYKNKDELFLSLVSEVIEVVEKRSKEIKEFFVRLQQTNKPADLLSAMRYEGKIYFDILFDYYDQCVLLACKSGGSSAAEKSKKLMEYKIESVVSLLKKCSSKGFDVDGITFILKSQFRYYTLVLEKGDSKERALEYMKTVYDFLEAGWTSIFEKIL